MSHSVRYRRFGAPAMLLSLAVLVVFSVLGVLPPSPAGSDAAATDFSASRALEHVKVVADEVHAAGSPAADAVREHIVATTGALGLRTEVQDAVGATDALGNQFAMARVRNVVAVLPGTNSTGPVFLVAHYDSVQVSYGANDDGAGVATLLETARALAAGPRQRNDLVFVFTDAEEACLCGAEAFVGQHPLAKAGGVALNFEARGASGPAIMFETSDGNTDLVGLYGESVPDPVGTSLAVEVYRLLPNDTDFTPFLQAGRFGGLNSAYIDGSAVYHSPQDRPENLSQASLQHHGGNALALARAFGQADIPSLATPSGHDSTYFPVFSTMARYPGTLVWPVAVLALLAVLAFAVLVRRRGEATWGKLAAGFGLAILPLVLAPAAAQLIWLLVTTLNPPYRDMIDPWQPMWFRWSVVAAVAAVVLAWFALLRKRIGVWALTIGALAWLAVLGAALAAAAPGGSYLAALPALAGAVAGIAALLAPRLAPVAHWLGAAVAIVILAPTVLLFFPALGLATGGAAALFATMLGMALLPVLDRLFPQAGDGSKPLRRRRFALPALACTALTVAFFVTGSLVDRFDSAHPVPTDLMYALDADTGQARWVSSETEPGEWTGQFVREREDLGAQFPLLQDTWTTGPAQVVSLPAPEVAVVADEVAGGKRTLTFKVQPQRAVRLVHVSLPGVAVEQATVAGREVPLGDNEFQVLFHAPPETGVDVTVVIAGTGPVPVRVMDGSDGLSELPGFVPRPVGVDIVGSHTSELALVARTVTL